jgi:hypothetical protein
MRTGMTAKGAKPWFLRPASKWFLLGVSLVLAVVAAVRQDRSLVGIAVALASTQGYELLPERYQRRLAIPMLLFVITCLVCAVLGMNGR